MIYLPRNCVNFLNALQEKAPQPASYEHLASRMWPKGRRPRMARDIIRLCAMRVRETYEKNGHTQPLLAAVHGYGYVWLGGEAAEPQRDGTLCTGTPAGRAAE